ncbi:hypothetical protein FHG87_002349 [Trinorchestia longiramus]|nr:hypothetical protein FHG87_002349 [Trinorchestia longiramus]
MPTAFGPTLLLRHWDHYRGVRGAGEGLWWWSVGAVTVLAITSRLWGVATPSVVMSVLLPGHSFIIRPLILFLVLN